MLYLIGYVVVVMILSAALLSGVPETTGDYCEDLAISDQRAFRILFAVFWPISIVCALVVAIEMGLENLFRKMRKAGK